MEACASAMPVFTSSSSGSSSSVSRVATSVKFIPVITRKAALRLGKPNNAKLVIKTVDDSIAAIKEGKTDKYSLMIVTGNVKDAVRLARETTQIKSINLGGTKSAPDRHALSHAVYVSDEEEKLLHEAAAEGIEVFIQAVPSDAKKILT